MNYLFFDTECANCFDGEGKICEFGYVLTDENFNVMEKDNVIINPECEFDKKGLGISKIKLALPYSQYARYGNFVEAYERIKALFSGDVLAIGHNTHADAQYLLYACNRYSLSPFDYRFIDTQKAVRELYQRQTGLRLIELHNEFCMENEKQSHVGLDDAVRTMDVAKHIFLDKGVSPKKAFFDCPVCSGEVFWGRVVEYEFNLLPYSDSSKLSNKKNKRVFDAFVAEMPKSKVKYSFPIEYEKSSFPQMMLILSRLKEKGYGYSARVNGATYVTLAENEYKLRFARRSRVISFDEFLKEAEITEDELKSPDVFSVVASMDEHREWYERFMHVHSTYRR